MHVAAGAVCVWHATFNRSCTVGDNWKFVSLAIELLWYLNVSCSNRHVLIKGGLFKKILCTLGGIALICFRFHISKHCGYIYRGLTGVKRLEISWEIQKYSLPGRPSSQNWVKWKNICPFLMNFDAFLNVFLVLLNFDWMVDLAMSIFEFLTKFLVIWHPRHPWVCIRSALKPLETDMSDSSYCESATQL